jgi:hypothetical protein
VHEALHRGVLEQDPRRGLLLDECFHITASSRLLWERALNPYRPRLFIRFALQVCGVPGRRPQPIGNIDRPTALDADEPGL